MKQEPSSNNELDQSRDNMHFEDIDFTGQNQLHAISNLQDSEMKPPSD